MSSRNIQVKIPVERVGVLIGSEGRIKAAIERRLNANITIDGKTGDISIICSDPDPSLLLRTRDIVLAIGRGFSPENAFKLLNEDLNIWIIDLREIFGNPSDVQRVKSRVIGKDGKTRKIIEEETMTNISIYGHTISIIGDVEHLEVSREAVEMLVKGALHSSVYKYLDRKRNELKDIEMELWKPTPDELKSGGKKHV